MDNARDYFNKNLTLFFQNERMIHEFLCLYHITKRKIDILLKSLSEKHIQIIAKEVVLAAHIS